MARTDIRAYLAGRGPVPAAALREALGVSPATLSRLVAAEPGGILRLGRGRATHYALPRLIPGLPAQLPVYRMDGHGQAQPAGELFLLENGGTWVSPLNEPEHAHDGLPPVVHDMAPAGYLGRRFADRHADLSLPRRLQDWSDDHGLIAVARRGEDCPGDLIIGQESLQRFFDAALRAHEESEYPALAEASALGGAGSSAAGEYPKFPAFVRGRHVLVKFSPGDGSPSDARWRDLLVCEAIALEVLAAHGVAAARARVLDVGARRFLEVERFDRIGARGRRGVLTLGPLDDDLFGRRDSWTAAAQRLVDFRMLSPMDARRIRLLDAFGNYIANGDRHFGNISFFADSLAARPALQLAPAYDMLPMDFAPQAGSVPPLAGPRVAPRSEWLDVWQEAGGLAQQFWRRVAEDSRISGEMRSATAQFAAENGPVKA